MPPERRAPARPAGTPAGAAPEAAEARSPAAHSTQAVKVARGTPSRARRGLSERERRAAGPILLQLDASLSELSH